MSVCLVCNTAVGAGKRKYLDVSTEPLLSNREILVRGRVRMKKKLMHFYENIAWYAKESAIPV